jgi:hypothetical protein
MFILLRLCCAGLSAFIFALYMPLPPYLLFRLSQILGENRGVELFWYASAFNELAFKVRGITIVLWMATCTLLELRNLRRAGQPTPKLLTHLRYGPIAILVFSVATIVASDFLLIQYSRWQIVRWIHSDAAVTESPSFSLHNNDRGWCGNGMSATEYYLYGDTAAAYIDDPDPAIRARALQASMYVYDWLNQPNDGPSITALKKATTDSDPMVRDIAAKFSAEVFRAP